MVGGGGDLADLALLLLHRNEGFLGLVIQLAHGATQLLALAIDPVQGIAQLHQRGVVASAICARSSRPCTAALTRRSPARRPRQLGDGRRASADCRVQAQQHVQREQGQHGEAAITSLMLAMAWPRKHAEAQAQAFIERGLQGASWFPACSAWLMKSATSRVKGLASNMPLSTAAR